MDSEAPSSSSSPSTTALSKINATTAHKKKGAKKATRRRGGRPRREMGGALRKSTEPPQIEMSLVNGGNEVEFVDEEALYNMPLLMNCMAQGMLLTPPSIKRGFDWAQNFADEEMEMEMEMEKEEDFTLWKY